MKPRRGGSPLEADDGSVQMLPLTDTHRSQGVLVTFDGTEHTTEQASFFDLTDDHRDDTETRP